MSAPTRTRGQSLFARLALMIIGLLALAAVLLFLALPWWLVALGWLVLSSVAIGMIWRARISFQREVRRLAGNAMRMAEDLPEIDLQPTIVEMTPIAEAVREASAQFNTRLDFMEARHSVQQIIHQSMSAGMIALDSQRRVININRAAERLLELSESATRGQLLQHVLLEPEVNRVITESIAQQQQVSRELELCGRAGVMVHAIAEPLRNSVSEPVGTLVLLSDITQLHKLETIRSDFAANVSHELRTPITNIKGYVETLLEVGVQDQDQSARFLNVIKRNTDRLASIIEDLLALARLEQPGAARAIERVETPLRGVIDAATNQVHEERTAKNILFSVNVPFELKVRINSQLIEQAVGNLLSNAVKYSPPDTTVTISARSRPGDEFEIAVADEGPGIAPEHLPRLFERFYRVDKARSRELGGTGLGLAIVKHIAQAHGGRAEVHSQLGQGSVFRIILSS